MTTTTFRALCFLGMLLFIVGAMMHVRRCTIYGKYAAWTRDHLATKCVPRIRTIGTSDVARDLKYDENAVINLASMKDYGRLTDVLLCHLMENFYDRDAPEIYSNAYELENFLFDYFVFAHHNKHHGNTQPVTIIEYLQHKTASKTPTAQTASNLLNALIAPHNANSASHEINVPPPTEKLDYAGNALPLSRQLDYTNSVQVIKPLPAIAYAYKNLSMDLMGTSDTSTIHPTIGLSLAELDSRFSEAVRRPGPF